MAGPSISEYQLKTRKEFYAYLDSKRKEGNSRFSLSLEKDPFSFSLYLLFTSNEGIRNLDLKSKAIIHGLIILFIYWTLKFFAES